MDANQKITRRDFLTLIPNYFVRKVRNFKRTLENSSQSTSGLKSSNDTRANKKVIARIDKDCCIAWDGGTCQFCYLACPLRDQAIVVDDQKPTVNSLHCDGCAKCQTACQTVNTFSAIRMEAVY